MNSVSQGDTAVPQQDPRIQALVQRHPLLFRNGPPELGSQVPAECAEALDPLCKGVDSRLSEASAQPLRLLQVKALEGVLRVYWSIEDPDSAGLGRGLQTLQVLADSAEAVPEATCYFIGAAGLTPYLGAWFRLDNPGHLEPAAEVTP